MEIREIILVVSKKDTPRFSGKIFVSTDQRYRKIVSCLYWQVDFTFLSFLKLRLIVDTFPVLSSCTGTQEPIQKTQQYATAQQRVVNKGVQ